MGEHQMMNKAMIRIGAICAVAVMGLTLTDLAVGMSLSAPLDAISASASAHFLVLQNQLWLGLYELDVLNLGTALVMIPVFVALYATLKSYRNGLLPLALVVFGIGTAVFINNNASLPMLALSKMAESASLDQRIMLETAGEALLIKGAHGSMGAYLGFMLSTLSTLLISIVMIQTRHYGKHTGWIGLAGSSLLMVYLTLVTFIPDAITMAMLLAAPGGILSLIWMGYYTVKLITLSR